MLPRSGLCIVFCKGWWGGVIFGPGWPPAGRGRECLFIGSSDKPLPEGEEGVVEEGRKISLDRLSPKGLAGIFSKMCVPAWARRMFFLREIVAKRLAHCFSMRGPAVLSTPSRGPGFHPGSLIDGRGAQKRPPEAENTETHVYPPP